MEQKRIGYYNYTVMLTYCGMLLAFFGILLSVNGYFRLAVVCLILSGICDMFDGAVAATKKDRTIREKRFGIQIDSLSDMVSFGVFPAVFVYYFSEKSIFAGVIAACYVLAGLIRLAYYNVLAEEKVQKDVKEKDKFLGLPITTSAIFLPAFYVLAEFGMLGGAVVFEIMLAVTAVGFLTPVEIRKPGIIGKTCILAAGTVGILVLILRFL